MIHKTRHNRLFKTTATVLVCLFLVNQVAWSASPLSAEGETSPHESSSIGGAYPDTLKPPVGLDDGRTSRQMRDMMERMLAERRGKPQGIFAGYLVMDDGKRVNIFTQTDDAKDLINIIFYTEQGEYIGYIDFRLSVSLLNHVYVSPNFRDKGFSYVMLDAFFAGIKRGLLSPDYTRGAIFLRAYVRNPLLAKVLKKYGFKKTKDIENPITKKVLTTELVMGDNLPSGRIPIFISDPMKKGNFAALTEEDIEDFGIFEVVDEPIEGERLEIFCEYALSESEPDAQRQLALALESPHYREIQYQTSSQLAERLRSVIAEQYARVLQEHPDDPAGQLKALEEWVEERKRQNDRDIVSIVQDGDAFVFELSDGSRWRQEPPMRYAREGNETGIRTRRIVLDSRRTQLLPRPSEEVAEVLAGLGEDFIRENETIVRGERHIYISPAEGCEIEVDTDRKILTITHPKGRYIRIRLDTAKVVEDGIDLDEIRKLPTTGQRIRRLRELKQFTMRELAEKVGVYFTAVSQWENDRSRPSRENQAKLARIFNVPEEITEVRPLSIEDISRLPTMGEKIRRLRELKELTQIELADEIGVRNDAVSNWERNIHPPKPKNLTKLAKALGVEEEIIKGELRISRKELSRIKQLPTMGERIRVLRELEELTQIQLADAIGVTNSTVSNWERNESAPMQANLTKLAEALGVDEDIIKGPPREITEEDLARVKALPPMGERIRALRELRELSRPVLAARIGVTKTTISSWENNTNIPKDRNLNRLAIELGVSDEFIRGGPKERRVARRKIRRPRITMGRPEVVDVTAEEPIEEVPRVITPEELSEIKQLPTMGERIRALRELEELTQIQLADTIGVTNGTVSDWERNEHPPNSKNLTKLAEALGVEEDIIKGPPREITEEDLARVKTLPPMGERIRALRELEELTQIQLADAIGVTNSTVSNWERNESAPMQANLTKLAEALGVEEEIIKGEPREITEEDLIRIRPLPTMGERIRAVRELKQLTQEKLGKIIGVGYDTVSHWETNEHPPSPENLTKLAEVLGVAKKDITGDYGGLKEDIAEQVLEICQRHSAPRARMRALRRWIRSVADIESVKQRGSDYIFVLSAKYGRIPLHQSPPMLYAREGDAAEDKGLTDEQLVRMIRAESDEKKRNEMIDEILERRAEDIKFIARKFLPDARYFGFTYEDLIVMTEEAVMEAIYKYDEKRGATFSTVVTKDKGPVIGAIRHALRDLRMIKLPAWVQEFHQAVVKVTRILEGELERQPTDEEIAERLYSLRGAKGYSVLERTTVRTKKGMLAMVKRIKVAYRDIASLDAARVDDEGKQMPEEEIIIAEPYGMTLETEEAALDRLEVAELKAMVRRLKPLEQQAFTLWYREDLTQTEVAKRMGISNQYASYLIRGAIAKIRRMVEEDERLALSRPIERPLPQPQSLRAIAGQIRTALSSPQTGAADKALAVLKFRKPQEGDRPTELRSPQEVEQIFGYARPLLEQLRTNTPSTAIRGNIDTFMQEAQALIEEPLREEKLKLEEIANLETFDARIQAAMAYRSIRSISDLSRASGVSHRLIYTYINGKYEPELKNIKKLAKALDMPEDALKGITAQRLNKIRQIKDASTRVKEAITLSRAPLTHIARSIGVSEMTIHGWIKNPNEERLRQIAQAIGFPYDVLAGERPAETELAQASEPSPEYTITGEAALNRQAREALAFPGRSPIPRGEIEKGLASGVPESSDARRGIADRVEAVLSESNPRHSEGYETEHGVFYPSRLEEAAEILDKIRRDYPGKRRFVDLGCGDGGVAIIAKLLGFESTGVELREELIEFAEAASNDILGLDVPEEIEWLGQDFFDLDLSSYDILYCYERGSESEGELLQKLAREMKPGAILVLYRHTAVWRDNLMAGLGFELVDSWQFPSRFDDGRFPSYAYMKRETSQIARQPKDLSRDVNVSGVRGASQTQQVDETTMTDAELRQLIAEEVLKACTQLVDGERRLEHLRRQLIGVSGITDVLQAKNGVDYIFVLADGRRLRQSLPALYTAQEEIFASSLAGMIVRFIPNKDDAARIRDTEAIFLDVIETVMKRHLGEAMLWVKDLGSTAKLTYIDDSPDFDIAANVDMDEEILSRCLPDILDEIISVLNDRGFTVAPNPYFKEVFRRVAHPASPFYDLRLSVEDKATGEASAIDMAVNFVQTDDESREVVSDRYLKEFYRAMDRIRNQDGEIGVMLMLANMRFARYVFRQLGIEGKGGRQRGMFENPNTEQLILQAGSFDAAMELVYSHGVNADGTVKGVDEVIGIFPLRVVDPIVDGRLLERISKETWGKLVSLAKRYKEMKRRGVFDMRLDLPPYASGAVAASPIYTITDPASPECLALVHRNYITESTTLLRPQPSQQLAQAPGVVHDPSLSRQAREAVELRDRFGVRLPIPRGEIEKGPAMGDADSGGARRDEAEVDSLTLINWLAMGATEAIQTELLRPGGFKRVKDTLLSPLAREVVGDIYTWVIKVGEVFAVDTGEMGEVDDSLLQQLNALTLEVIEIVRRELEKTGQEKLEPPPSQELPEGTFVIQDPRLTQPLYRGYKPRNIDISTLDVAKKTLKSEKDGEQSVDLYLNPAILDLLPQEIREQIEGNVTWRKLSYSRLSGGRTIIIDIPEPITVKGREIRAIKIKGIGFIRGGKMIPPIMEPHMGAGLPAQRYIVGEQGHITRWAPEPEPEGAMLFWSATNEYDITLSAFNAGASVNYPMGFGRFTDLDFNGEAVGFVILGIEGAEDIRVTDLHNKLKEERIANIYEQVGRELRRFHDLGFISQFPQSDNFQVLLDGNRVVMQDLDKALKKSELSPAAILGYQVLDLRHYIGTQELRAYECKAFFRGYFHDILTPQQVDEHYDTFRDLRSIFRIPGESPLTAVDVGIVPFVRQVLAKTQPPTATAVLPAEMTTPDNVQATTSAINQTGDYIWDTLFKTILRNDLRAIEGALPIILDLDFLPEGVQREVLRESLERDGEGKALGILGLIEDNITQRLRLAGSSAKCKIEISSGESKGILLARARSYRGKAILITTNAKVESMTPQEIAVNKVRDITAITPITQKTIDGEAQESYAHTQVIVAYAVVKSMLREEDLRNPEASLRFQALSKLHEILTGAPLSPVPPATLDDPKKSALELLIDIPSAAPLFNSDQLRELQKAEEMRLRAA